MKYPFMEHKFYSLQQVQGVVKYCIGIFWAIIEDGDVVAPAFKGYEDTIGIRRFIFVSFGSNRGDFMFLSIFKNIAIDICFRECYQ